MAGFKTHVTFSGLLGCGYVGAGYLYGMPPDTALVGGALCGFSGMLPDLDSDYGVPLRETMCFVSATVPMLLLDRFATLRLQHDQVVLLAVSMYLLMRFGVTKMIRKYTVHRGMFHSIPAGLTFAGLAFLICGSPEVEMRYFKAGGVLAGFMSHLLLDEIYSVEWKGGRWRLKKSFGTAIKLWGDDTWANFSTYAKMLAVAAVILGEPSVMARLEARNPGIARGYQNLQDQYQNWSGGFSPAATFDSIRGRINSNLQTDLAAPPATGAYPSQQPPMYAPRSYETLTPPAAAPGYHGPYDDGPSNLAPPAGRDDWDTAQRPAWPAAQ